LMDLDFEGTGMVHPPWITASVMCCGWPAPKHQEPQPASLSFLGEVQATIPANRHRLPRHVRSCPRFCRPVCLYCTGK
jgi:hypothetical protein